VGLHPQTEFKNGFVPDEWPSDIGAARLSSEFAREKICQGVRGRVIEIEICKPFALLVFRPIENNALFASPQKINLPVARRRNHPRRFETFLWGQRLSACPPLPFRAIAIFESIRGHSVPRLAPSNGLPGLLCDKTLVTFSVGKRVARMPSLGHSNNDFESKVLALVPALFVHRSDDRTTNCPVRIFLEPRPLHCCLGLRIGISTDNSVAIQAAKAIDGSFASFCGTARLPLFAASGLTATTKSGRSRNFPPTCRGYAHYSAAGAEGSLPV